jgi:RES domain-containing protein
VQLWRLSSRRHARHFDGGYGLANDGRWNTRGRAVTYCATGPALTALERRVHVIDPDVLPPLVMVEYEAPDDISSATIALSDLPAGWIMRQADTQMRGNRWLDRGGEALLFVPSVIVPLARGSDRNVIVNHRHPQAASIKAVAFTPFTFDPRLFAT